MSDRNHFTVTRSGDMDLDTEEKWKQKRERLVEKLGNGFARERVDWSPTEIDEDQERKERGQHVAHATSVLAQILAKAEAERLARVAAGLE